jgi:hypothetical protein
MTASEEVGKGLLEEKERIMRVLIAICILVVGALVGCGGGPTAPNDTATQVTPVPTPLHPAPTPNLPCRPYPKCLR